MVSGAGKFATAVLLALVGAVLTTAPGHTRQARETPPRPELENHSENSETRRNTDASELNLDTVAGDRARQKYRRSEVARQEYLMRGFAPPQPPEEEQPETEPEEEAPEEPGREEPPAEERVEDMERRLGPGKGAEKQVPEKEAAPSPLPDYPELPPGETRRGPDATEWKQADPPEQFAKLVIEDGRMSGDIEGGNYTVEGDFFVQYSEMRVSSDRAEINEEREINRFIGNAEAKNPEFTLTADRIRVNNQNQTMHAEGLVSFKRTQEGDAPTGERIERETRITNLIKNQKSELLSNELDYNWETEELDARGEVKVSHPWFSASAETLNFIREREAYELSGGVVIKMQQYDWLFDNDLVAPSEQEITREIANEETVLNAENVTISDRDAQLIAEGSEQSRAKVSQSDKFLEAETISIDEDEKLITAESNVHLWQENGQWLVEGGQIDPAQQDPDFMDRLDREVHLTGESFRFQHQQKDMTVTGRVVVVNGNIISKSGRLSYDDREKVLNLERQVLMVRNQSERLKASRIRINTETRNFEFFGYTDGFFAFTGTTGSQQEGEDQQGEGQAEQGEDRLIEASDYFGEQGAEAETQTATGTRQE